MLKNSIEKNWIGKLELINGDSEGYELNILRG